MSDGVTHSCAPGKHGDGKCATCPACVPHRLNHNVTTPRDTLVQVLRCSYCDGPDAHKTVKP